MEETFHYRTYGKGELARLYSPNVSLSAACRKLTRWMRGHPTLMEDLYHTGFVESARIYTPIQVRLIVQAFGEP